MSIQKNVFMVIDTETADLTGAVYDLGWVICDKNGNTISEYNALVREVFTDADRMMGAFYAKKIFTHYADMLDNSDIALVHWSSIIERLRSDIADYNVTVICAYNAGFDFRVLGNTHSQLGYTGKILPSALKTLDLWQFACETKLSQKQYKRVAREQGWVSPKGNIKTGAEFAYRYVSANYGFIEDHTALSDARIEAQILAECFRQKKPVPYGKINGAPWRLVQEAA